MRHFLNLLDIGKDGVVELLDAADHFKETRGSSGNHSLLAGKSVALIFEKVSTRTRISLEVAVNELGGSPLVVPSMFSQMGRGEPIEDTARVLSRMVHAIALRTFAEKTLTDLARACTVPVLNALTDTGHPMQLLADLQTVRREFGTLSGLKYVWVGDGNNMANSWIEAAAVFGLDLTLACPVGFQPETERVSEANRHGAKVTVVTDPGEACRKAHVINTDVFTSMGQEAEAERRRKAFQNMCVDRALLELADPKAIVLHCLPAHRGEEISAEVIEGPHARVWDQAEARLHTSKAALCWALEIGL
jgi:ornithine carbamoyltransferase